MYRPDRIGPYNYFDADKIITQADFNVANFDTLDAPDNTGKLYVWIRSATVPDSLGFDTFFSDAVTLAATSMFSFGVAVSGTWFEHGLLFTMDSQVFIASDKDMLVLPWIGQLDASTITVTHSGQENDLTHGRWLGPDCMFSVGNQLVCSVKQSMNWLQLDEAVPSEEYPIAHGFTIINSSGSAANIDNIRASVSLHKYIEDLPTYEPVRS